MLGFIYTKRQHQRQHQWQWQRHLVCAVLKLLSLRVWSSYQFNQFYSQMNLIFRLRLFGWKNNTSCLGEQSWNWRILWWEIYTSFLSPLPPVQTAWCWSIPRLCGADNDGPQSVDRTSANGNSQTNIMSNRAVVVVLLRHVTVTSLNQS